MKTRVLTAIVGLIVLVIALCFFQTPVFNAAVALVAMMAIYEVICALGKEHKQGLMAISFLFAAFVLCYDLMPFSGVIPLFTVTFFYLLAMLSNAVFLFEKISFADVCVSILETFIILICFGLLLSLRRFAGVHGIYYVVLCLVCAWGADTGAYFAGRFFGRHKLAPHVSPKKTIEGSVGGALVCMLLVAGCTLLYQRFVPCQVNFVALMSISFVAALIGMMGDLIASCLKRQHNVKDFGWIMPGHGGVMDRFDSVLFTVPTVVLLSMNFPIIF